MSWMFETEICGSCLVGLFKWGGHGPPGPPGPPSGYAPDASKIWNLLKVIFIEPWQV